MPLQLCSVIVASSSRALLVFLTALAIRHSGIIVAYICQAYKVLLVLVVIVSEGRAVEAGAFPALRLQSRSDVQKRLSFPSLQLNDAAMSATFGTNRRNTLIRLRNDLHSVTLIELCRPKLISALFVDMPFSKVGSSDQVVNTVFKKAFLQFQ